MDLTRYFKKASPRIWQSGFLSKYVKSLEDYRDNPDQGFLLYATPGAGKTVAMCATATFLLEGGLIDWVVIVVPQASLCSQVASDAKALFGLDLRSGKDGADSQFKGEVITIQSLKHRDDSAVRRRANRVLLCVDEFHHPSSRNSWGDDLARTLGQCSYKLFCTGTPFRSDRSELKYVKYEELSNGELQLIPDFAYPYRDALRDSTTRADGSPTPSAERIVRTAQFHLYDATEEDDLIEWADPAAPDICFKHRLSDNLAVIYEREAEFTERQRRSRLLAAINPKFKLARRMLRDAVVKLDEIRRSHGHAAGLVVCKDKRHADLVAEFMRKNLGIDPLVVYQGADGGESSQKIKAFRKHTSPHKWIVAVQQVSEGVDIKRLRVCVWLTDKLTHLIFLQILGRIIRWEHLEIHGKLITPAYDQMAHMFMPAQGSDTQDRDEPIELVKYAKEIEEDVRLVITPPITRNCDVCGDNPASFGSGNCINAENCPLFRRGGGGGGGTQDRILIGAGGVEMDAILRGEFYDPALLNSLDGLASEHQLPLDRLVSFLQHVEVEDFAKAKKAATSARTEKSERIAVSLGVTSQEAEDMTVSEQMEELKGEVKRKVGELGTKIANHCQWPDNHSRRQSIYKDIHALWCRKFGGKKSKDATVDDLVRKIEWLNQGLRNLAAGRIDEDLTRG